MNDEFFPNDFGPQPRIYAYSDSHPQYEGLLKVGYTTKSVEERVKQQYGVISPGENTYTIQMDEPAIRSDGSTFTDIDVHKKLRLMEVPNPRGEWFRCDVCDVQSALRSVALGGSSLEGRQNNFSMRPEQVDAVKKASHYFRSFRKEQGRKASRFLWNAKMRFGKTFAAYHLAIEMQWTKVLVLTFKPAVQSAWQEDLLTHEDFVGWQFVHRDGIRYENVDKSKPFVCFGSFQDFLGRNSAGGIKLKNEWAHAINWDCIIFDEYHYGAWRDSALELFDAEYNKEVQEQTGKGINYFDEEGVPITTDHYLYLSGTPFRALESGEFIEEQIYNWTYSDEQRAKHEWKGDSNPYLALPRMVILTYQLPDSIKDIAKKGEHDEFDLNVFFSASGEGGQAKFAYESEVQMWLDLIRGKHLETMSDNLKLGASKPPFPFADSRLLKVLNHTFWFLPSVSSCYAMHNLLYSNQNQFFHEFKVVIAAGPEAGLGVKALDPVRSAMDNPLKSKTITLSCGKLATGVSVKPWRGIFMLRNCTSPETYFQAAFRVQTPWEINNPDGVSPNRRKIVKKECYVFDFAPNRALRQIADYSTRLNVNDSNPERKVEDFIKFLPVLAYDGSSMKQIDAGGVLDMAMSGTSATLLARRWESALLVNVDNATLKRLLKNKTAVNALMRLEGFRSLNRDIEIIINKSESIKKVKQNANRKQLTQKQRKKLTKEQKEYNTLRNQIQDKLKKFSTRIPVFMYLTDHRERSLKDVISQLEPGLFKKVTGISVEEFDLLISLNVFNSSLMNEAVYKFKRYEDASLIYSGIDKHAEEEVGLYDTVVSAKEFKSM